MATFESQKKSRRSRWFERRTPESVRFPFLHFASFVPKSVLHLSKKINRCIYSSIAYFLSYFNDFLYKPEKSENLIYYLVLIRDRLTSRLQPPEFLTSFSTFLKWYFYSTFIKIKFLFNLQSRTNSCNSWNAFQI